MAQVRIVATNPGTERKLSKLIELQKQPMTGGTFHLKDKAFDGVIIAEEVCRAHGDTPIEITVHVKDGVLDRMSRNGWIA